MGEEHSGHRARMRERLLSGGLDGFQPHEVIELLLYYAIPLRDVNQTAHALIDRFGSVQGVLSASEERLACTEGVGPGGARLLAELGRQAQLYEMLRLSERPRLVTLSAVVESMRRRFAHSAPGRLGVLLEDRAGFVLSCESFLWRGPLEERLRGLVHYALRQRAHNAVVLHALGESAPSYSALEVEEANSLVHTLAGLDIYTADFLLLRGGEVESLRGEQLLRETPATLRETARLYENWFD